MVNHHQYPSQSIPLFNTSYSQKRYTGVKSTFSFFWCYLLKNPWISDILLKVYSLYLYTSSQTDRQIVFCLLLSRKKYSILFFNNCKYVGGNLHHLHQCHTNLYTHKYSDTVHPTLMDCFVCQLFRDVFNKEFVLDAQ